MMTRRKFLIGGATAAGALIVGYGLWPSGRLAREDSLAAGPCERFLANWIKIANDGRVTVVIPHCDMGTGILTSLSQMAADELDADWAKSGQRLHPRTHSSRIAPSRKDMFSTSAI